VTNRFMSLYIKNDVTIIISHQVNDSESYELNNDQPSQVIMPENVMCNSILCVNWFN